MDGLTAVLNIRQTRQCQATGITYKAAQEWRKGLESRKRICHFRKTLSPQIVARTPKVLKITEVERIGNNGRVDLRREMRAGRRPGEKCDLEIDNHIYVTQFSTRMAKFIKS